MKMLIPAVAFFIIMGLAALSGAPTATQSVMSLVLLFVVGGLVTIFVDLIVFMRLGNRDDKDSSQ